MNKQKQGIKGRVFIADYQFSMEIGDLKLVVRSDLNDKPQAPAVSWAGSSEHSLKESRQMLKDLTFFNEVMKPLQGLEDFSQLLVYESEYCEVQTFRSGRRRLWVDARFVIVDRRS